MKDYKLNTNDYNNINNLIRLSEELCLNYQNLYKLDFNIYQEYLLFIIDNFSNKLNNNIINNITSLNYKSLQYKE